MDVSKRKKSRDNPVKGDQSQQPLASSQPTNDQSTPQVTPVQNQGIPITPRPVTLGVPTTPVRSEYQNQGVKGRVGPSSTIGEGAAQSSNSRSQPPNEHSSRTKFLDRLPTLDGVVSKIWRNANLSQLSSNLSEIGLYGLAYINGALASNNAYMALTDAAQNYGMTTQPNWGNIPVIAQTGGMLFLEKLADAMKRKSTSQLANALGTAIQIGVTGSEIMLGSANLVVAAYYTPITGAALRGIIDYISPGESLELDLMLFPIYQGNPTVPFFIGMANLYAARQEKDYGLTSRRTPSSYKRTEHQVGSSSRSVVSSFMNRFKR